MNLKTTLSPDDLARACAEAMWKEDDASQGLGMELLEIKAGKAVLAMKILPHGEWTWHRPWRFYLHAG